RATASFPTCAARSPSPRLQGAGRSPVLAKARRKGPTQDAAVLARRGRKSPRMWRNVDPERADIDAPGLPRRKLRPAWAWVHAGSAGWLTKTGDVLNACIDRRDLAGGGSGPGLRRRPDLGGGQGREGEARSVRKAPLRHAGQARGVGGRPEMRPD